MFFPFNTLVKTLLAVFLCTLLAACQTSGLKPGSLTTSFLPKGWVTKSKGAHAIFACLPPTCKSPEVVVIGPVKVRGDVETAIREDLLSKDLMSAVSNLVNVAAKGQVKFKTERRIVTKSYSGFDMTSRYRTKRGYDYAAARIIIQQNRGSVIASFARSAGKAKSNLRRFLKRTKIQRIR